MTVTPPAASPAPITSTTSALVSAQWQLQDSSAIGGGVSLPRAAALLRSAAQSLEADAADKMSVARAVVGVAVAAGAQIERGAQVSDVMTITSPVPTEQLADRFRVWQAAWLLAPRLQAEEAAAALQALAEALAAAAC
jgi:hypothetical protein